MTNELRGVGLNSGINFKQEEVMIKYVFFDMNETMLNIHELGKTFDKYFNEKYVAKYWFTKLLHTSTVMGAMDEYQNFGKLAEVVLESLFYENNIKLTKDIKSDILGAFRRLPAYEDVAPALKNLKENNVKVIALSNSSLEMIKEQLSNAGILELFDGYYSVDSVGKYKPFNSIYQYVVKEVKVDVTEVAMVASHDWDLFGAKKVGLKTAYIQRKKEIYNPYYYEADIRENNMIDVAKEILKLR